MKKKHVALVLRLLISVGLIGYFLFALSRKYGGLGPALQQFTAAFSGASLAWLLPASLLHLVGFSLMSIRWRILLKAQSVEASFGQLFAYYFMAAFFNTFLPSTIGGDTVRALESKKLTGNTTTSVMVVIVERLTGFMALALIATCALIIKISRSHMTDPTVWIFVVIMLGAFVLLIGGAHPKIAPVFLRLLGKILPAKIHALLVRAHDAVCIFYNKPAALFSALGVSIVFQLVMVFYYFMLASALNCHPDLVEFGMMVPIMIVLLMTVPAINGMGIRTAGFQGLMKFPAAYALALECLDLVLRLFYGLLGGVFFLLYKRNQQ